MSLKTQSGQIVVEYLLLLVLVVAMASLIVKQLASRNPDAPGILIQKWTEMQKEIGDDTPN